MSGAVGHCSRCGAGGASARTGRGLGRSHIHQGVRMGVQFTGVATRARHVPWRGRGLQGGAAGGGGGGAGCARGVGHGTVRG